ncbi:MAG: hypothetical protein IT320_07620 [Anaerolineae bacterium]|nr:hypothetical protein [Anaerolineae bacterium]
MFIFGILALVMGILGITSPDTLLSLINFQIIDPSTRAAGDYTLVFITASSMASLNMGAYYVLASLVDFKAFYMWTVPFRVLTFTVFTLAISRGIAPSGFFGVALWELIGALLTGAALLWERRSNSGAG